MSGTQLVSRLARGVAVAAALATIMAGTAVAAQAAPVTGKPIGNLDSVTAVAGGVRVKGWAWDPDSAQTVTLTVTAGASTTRITATLPRADVARALPQAGPYRGFDVTVTTAPGPTTVCVVATNIGAGTDKAFTCTTVTVLSSVPIGNLEAVTATADGVRVAGWAADRDTVNPISVRIAVGSTSREVATSLPRADVVRAFPGVTSTAGFDTAVPVEPGTYDVCVTALNVGPGANRTFTCRTVTVIDHDPAGALESAVDADGTLRVTGWASDVDATSPLDVALAVVSTTARGAATTQTVTADRPRAGETEANGFVASLDLQAGTYQVCSTALNTGAGADKDLGCITADVLDHRPTGVVDPATDATSGGLAVSGRASDIDTAAPLTVRLSVTGSGTTATLTADMARTDGPAFSGFWTVLPLAPGTYEVCATAVNVGPGADADLGCSTGTVLDHSPTGALDPASDAAAGGLSVSGWASDPDTATASVRLDVTGTATSSTTVTAGEARADRSTTSGFATVLRLAPGAYQVCATALNAGAGTDNPLGCTTATVLNHAPYGAVDTTGAVTSGVTVTGWAVDPDTTAPITVRIAVGGTSTTVTTAIARADVAAANPGAGPTSGFSATVPAAVGTHQVCVTAINVAAGVDTALGCRPVTVAPTAPVSTVPGPTTTGVPAGTILTVHNGDLTVTTPGTVIDGMDIRGYLRIKAANVTVRNSIVRGRAGLTGSMALIQNSSPGVVITDTELVAAYPTWGVDGFVGSNATFTRVNIHGVIDSIKLSGGNVAITDSWLHDNLYFATTPAGHDTHNDNLQIQAGSNIAVRNTVMTGTRNAVMMITQDTGAVSNVSFTGNQVDNGACSLNIAEKSYGPVRGLTVTNNTFGVHQLKAYCAVIAPLTTSSISTISGNTFADGSPFKVTRG